jgi:hypothetical protein
VRTVDLRLSALTCWCYRPGGEIQTDTDQIAAQLRDLLSPSGGQDTIASLLEQDHVAVAEAALRRLHLLGVALRAEGLDADALLASNTRRSSKDKLAERLRRGSAYQEGAPK